MQFKQLAGCKNFLSLILMFLLELEKLAIHQVFTQNYLENTKDLTEHMT